jgi:hypothetical protein
VNILYRPNSANRFSPVAAPAPDGRETRTYECAYALGKDDRAPSLMDKINKTISRERHASDIEWSLDCRVDSSRDD